MANFGFISKGMEPDGATRMLPAEIAANYRMYAAHCVEISKDLNPARKLALLNVAQAWLNLADQVVKNHETVLVYETPVRRPRPSGGPGPTKPPSGPGPSGDAG